MNCIFFMMLGILTLCCHFVSAQGVYERPAVVATVNCQGTYHSGHPVRAACRVTSMGASAYQQVCWNVYYAVQCQLDPHAWLGWVTPSRLCASLPPVGQSTLVHYNLDQPQPRCQISLKDGATFALTADGLGLYNQRSAIPTAPPPAHSSSTAKIEPDIASWNPRSSIPLKRSGPMSISQSNLDSLKKWAGKYPILLEGFKGIREEERLPSKSFFELPYIREGLINLPADDFNKIAGKKGWLMVPIKLISDYLVVERYREHSAASENVILAVSLYDGSMHVGFWNEDEKDSRKIRWFSTKGNYKDLPKEILDSWYSDKR